MDTHLALFISYIFSLFPSPLLMKIFSLTPMPNLSPLLPLIWNQLSPRMPLFSIFPAKPKMSLSCSSLSLSHCGLIWFLVGIWWFDMIFGLCSSWVQLSGWCFFYFFYSFPFSASGGDAVVGLSLWFGFGFGFVICLWIVFGFVIWFWVCDFGGWGLRLWVVVKVAIVAVVMVEWLVVEWVLWLLSCDYGS